MKKLFFLFSFLFTSSFLFGNEANLVVPDQIKGEYILYWGFLITTLGLFFGLYQYLKVKKLPVHESMADVAAVIYDAAKTYLLKQGRMLILLFMFIGAIMAFYFGYLSEGFGLGGTMLILGWTVLGILGSYVVAWFGIRVNTYANARMAFASLKRKPIMLFNIPLNAGMSIGVMLISLELMMMLIILLLVPGEYAGVSFIGFAIGESLGAAVLRIGGGIFTKIADIGSDLMKNIFGIGEDDPRNPGTIADCVGDNAGDSVGPSADGFETYGVTGVALISFILLAVTGIEYQVQLLTWIFVMRILMIVTSVFSFAINNFIAKLKYENVDDIDFEKPLTSLVWISSLVSIGATFLVSFWLIGDIPNGLWFTLSIIISIGTLGAAIIPEITKIFTSTKSKHVREIVEASRQGGPSLNILEGLVVGNFSAFWKGLVFVGLMFAAYVASAYGLSDLMVYPSIFAFGLVAFGMLGMGPVTIAVDSYGPVTDNAQSIYELSLIEDEPNIKNVIESKFGFTPDFEKAKYYLESNDSAGNTFKAGAKPVLIGTAAIGSVTMIFSLVLLIEHSIGVDPVSLLSILNPYTIFGLLLGGAVIYWFTGASMKAVATGAGRAVEFIKENIKIDKDAPKKADIEASKEVVKICTEYSQKGLWNIFIPIFLFALAFAFFSAPTDTSNEPIALFVGYLLGIAFFGLYQAVFMANAGGAWDNAKKYVEVDLDEKGTKLHESVVIGDTVGDPFKDTSSVSLNPVIKFSTLFGLLAMDIALVPGFAPTALWIGWIFFIIALYFVYRSFYGMRINVGKKESFWHRLKTITGPFRVIFDERSSAVLGSRSANPAQIEFLKKIISKK